jgi:predicted transcriptional regulator
MRILFIILLIILTFVISAQAGQGDYTIDLHPSQGGLIDSHGADDTVSFWDLPFWIQIGWITGIISTIIGLVWLGPFFLGRIRNLLKNPNRMVILGFIENNPGCTLANLTTLTRLNRGTVKYHIYLLLAERKIVQKKVGKMKYLFKNGGIQPEEKMIFGYIQNAPKRKILITILKQPGISNTEIAQRLFLNKSTTYWHLYQLLRENVVIYSWDGRNKKYFLNDGVEKILSKYCLEGLS